jgi:hypothetical protein
MRDARGHPTRGENLTGAPAKPIELAHRDDVARLEPSHERGQLRAIGAHAAGLLTVEQLRRGEAAHEAASERQLVLLGVPRDSRRQR